MDQSAFVSYVHADNDMDGGRILDLINDLAKEYEGLTGTRFSIATDRLLSWGDDWRPRLEILIEDATFFIPIITTRFFMSSECRRELTMFLDVSQTRGRSTLVLPILYIDVEGLAEDSDDHLKATVARIQFENWTTIRLTDRNSSEYRVGINRLAQQLRDRAAAMPDISQTSSAQFPSPVGAESVDAFGDDDASGLEDLLELDTLIKAATQNIEEWANTVYVMTDIVNETTDSLESTRNQGGRTRAASGVRIMQSLAARLDPVSLTLENLSNTVRVQFASIDHILQDLIQHDSDELLITSAELIQLAAQAETSVDSFDGMIESMAPLARQSRALRTPLKRIRDAALNMRDLQPLIQSWADLALGRSNAVE